MRSVSGWLTVGVVAALLVSGFTLSELSRLQRHLEHFVGTDELVVPKPFGLNGLSAGLAPDGNQIVLWMGPYHNPAQTRITVDKAGKQDINFYDVKGRLRLSVGIDASGRAHLTALDEHGKPQPIPDSTMETSHQAAATGPSTSR